MENIITKLGSQTSLSPAMLNVVQGVRQVGLHKIAAQMRGQDAFGLEHAVFELGTKLAYNYLKQQKIASGIRSLKTLEAQGDIKLAAGFGQMARQGQELFDPAMYQQMARAADDVNPATYKAMDQAAAPAAANAGGGLMPRPTMPGQNVAPVGGAPGLGAPQTMPQTLPGGGGMANMPANAPQAAAPGAAVPGIGQKSLLGIPQR